MKFKLVILLILIAASTAFAQRQGEPEKSVANFSLLGGEEAAKIALQGYSPRFDNERGLPKYYFYNEYGNQVMALTAFSRERPYLIVGIEVFGVDETYQKKHFQLKSVAFFTTESGFFLGARPSATSLLFAVPNTTTPKDVINKKSAPAKDEKSGKNRILRYEMNAPNLSGASGVKANAYRAEYEFHKNRLSRFSIAVDAAAENNSN